MPGPRFDLIRWALDQRKRESRTASLWQELLEAGSVDNAVVTYADGSGSILARVDWNPATQRDLTELFRTCINELWASLDSLVAETVETYSVRKRPRHPDRPRFFPLADSLDNFQALLEESCLDGVLQPHFAMIRDCQPFQGSSEDQHVDDLRSGLRDLLAWTHALEADAQVGAWATPVEPQVLIEEPLELEHLVVSAPGELIDERVLAEFRLLNYTVGLPVSAQAGTYVDLSFADGFSPGGVDDTFDRRLNAVIGVVIRIAASFSWLSAQVPGSRRVLLANNAYGTTWRDATRSIHRWAEADLAGVAASELGLGVAPGVDELTLIVATPDGVFERVVPNATPLRAHDRPGLAAEAAVQDAAATWGLPDFVMLPSVERKGTGIREISDGLLVVGDIGLIVQIKTRETEPGTTAREVSWITKQIHAAVKQVNGTARRLATDTTEMANGRGQSIRISGPTIRWAGVVIIEHPDPPSNCEIPLLDSRIPAVVLLRRDWEFLFDQLRSSHAVVSYLHRAGTPAQHLGEEPQRYYELAAADAAASPGPIDPTIAGRGRPWSVPLLPTAPAGSDDDEAHGLVRLMLEDIATSCIEPEYLEDRQRLLASLDSLPVGHRTELGRLLFEGLQRARRAEPGSTFWQFRTFLLGQNRDQLGFGVCSSLTETTKLAFQSWLLLRHHERGIHENLSELTSIGVLLTPRNDGHRDWDTTMTAVHGDPGLTVEEIGQYQELWNRPH
ncbi:hypothetical protein ACFXJ8_23470 [Nonomuraea sp. NPDC059194]|uniref:hypothetical protein n=1 Tax=Nonomuraea sp. NPDC059194 TaxID=3346764 RepID=UPI0036C158CF